MMPTALIAEDEPLLAANLQAELARLWPELRVVANVEDGEAAVERALALRPDLLFLDIRMPGLTGLEAVQALAEDWPETNGRPFPLVVFVTAYDQFAVEAFAQAAFDYVLKPVQTERLNLTCIRLRAALQRRASDNEPALATVIEQLRMLLPRAVGASAGATSVETPLRVIQVGTGNVIAMVPIDDVIYFESADKYVRVVTAQREYIIRLSLRELLPRLDPQRFWQIHRSRIVKCDEIAQAVRDETGKLALTLHGHADTLSVSRLYAHLFKGM
jgi:DNA-binding LytR/AlgR family response regulator